MRRAIRGCWTPADSEGFAALLLIVPERKTDIVRAHASRSAAALLGDRLCCVERAIKLVTWRHPSRLPHPSTETIKRSTISRTYTRAYLALGTGHWEGKDYTWRKTGFSSSAEQARKSMDGELAFTRRNGHAPSFAEVVAVTPIGPR